jgi:hypothetical protein
MTFSERYGYKHVKSIIQIDSMDNALRNALWNSLETHYWNSIKESSELYGGFYLSDPKNGALQLLCRRLWMHFFKKPLDTMPNAWKKTRPIIRGYFFDCLWYEVYDFIEFVANNHRDTHCNEIFMRTCNAYLEREVSAYRFVGGKIVRIVAEEETTAIEEALDVKVPPVREHLDRALQMLADRQHPDYRNSIKESISAVEALVKTVTKSEKGTLGSLLADLERQGKLHPALKSAFGSLYGYTSDADGIRHALMGEDRVTFDQAKFMLVACSAFTNYVDGTLRQ